MGEFYTIRELADRLKVSDDTIRRRMKEIPDLEYAFVGKCIRIPEAQAERILKRIQKLANVK